MAWEVDVKVRGSSVHGMGVYAADRIKAGTRVWRYDSGMYLCTHENLKKYDAERLSLALLSGYLHVPTGNFLWFEDGMQFLNHADAGFANVGSYGWEPLQNEACYALRDIEPGEELREDYGIWSIFNLPQDHWLLQLYREHRPDHYFFMQSLAEERDRRVA